MKYHMKEVRVKNLFEVRSGDCHATSELDPGDIPLISCGDLNNGLVGYFDIPSDWIYAHAITVAYNGSWPLTTKFHPYKFGAKDDVAVLLPLSSMKDSVMLYVAAHLNRMIWRYSYGRKCFREKLQDVALLVPVMNAESDVIDERLPDELFRKAFDRVSVDTRASIDGLFGRVTDSN
jgi:type I restriction enzyme M protein